MSKRKANGEDKTPSLSTTNVDGEDSGSDDDTSLLDVDFEYFDPSPTTDFHGLKTLLRQLFDVDNTLFDLSELTDLILSQPLLGSTVKCDGTESDPYAFLTVLNMHEHRSKAVMQQLKKYLLERTAGGSMAKDMTTLLDESNGKAQLGLILTERFINIPAQIIPPMYNMLLEEMRWANAEREPYTFTHYLIISKRYTEVASQLDAEMVEDERPQKKVKAKSESRHSGPVETFYFHPEDDVLAKHSLASCSFEYARAGEDGGGSDSKRVFSELGVKAEGFLVLIEESKLEGAVKAVEEFIGHGNGAAGDIT